MKDAKPYRYQVYERYAQLVKEQGVRWVMLHGAEYYPERIGRDLDCLCETAADAQKALACFKQAAQELPETKWVCFPHPIWGHRCVAISSLYEMAELHILPGLTSGPVSHRVQYDTVDWSATFPVEPRAFYLKAVVMPILGNSIKAERAFPLYGEENLPPCIRHAFATLKEKGSITTAERFNIYRHHCESIPGMIHGLLHSLKNKVWRYAAHTVPVFYVEALQYPPTEQAALEQALQEVFIKFKDCTDLPLRQIRLLQSQQYFLYTRRREHVSDAIDTEGRTGQALCDFVADRFAAYADYEV